MGGVGTRDIVNPLAQVNPSGASGCHNLGSSLIRSMFNPIPSRYHVTASSKPQMELCLSPPHSGLRAHTLPPVSSLASGTAAPHPTGTEGREALGGGRSGNTPHPLRKQSSPRRRFPKT